MASCPFYVQTGVPLTIRPCDHAVCCRTVKLITTTVIHHLQFALFAVSRSHTKTENTATWWQTPCRSVRPTCCSLSWSWVAHICLWMTWTTMCTWSILLTTAWPGTWCTEDAGLPGCVRSTAVARFSSPASSRIGSGSLCCFPLLHGRDGWMPSCFVFCNYIWTKYRK